MIMPFAPAADYTTISETFNSEYSAGRSGILKTLCCFFCLYI